MMKSEGRNDVLDPMHPVEEIPAVPPGVLVKTLANGLTVIVREDTSAPVVSAQAWCRAGSIDEGRWLGGGLSHVLEHMLFKGTTTRGAGRIDQEVQDVGGYMNAYTSFDRTVYWINVPNTGATVAIDILCDIMQNATLPEEEMAKEKQVILREMDMTHDDPGQRSARRLFETAYTRSPYRFTIIGYPDIYNEVQREDVLAYYREKYAPNNLFFVVVGDIKADAALAQIEAAFAKAKSKPLPPSVLPEEPSQTAPREVVEEAPIEMAYFHYSWHIPGLRHADVPVLDVLATLLGSGRSSRLYQEVREKQGLVNTVDAWTYSPGNPGLIGMSAVVEADKVEEARVAMLAQVERMKEDLVSVEELGKAVKQFVSGTLASRKTMQGQAQNLGGSWMAAHDLNFSARYLEAVKRATPADVQRVARQYLTVENRTLYALVPEGSVRSTAVEARVDAENPARKFDLPNGLRLLVKECHKLPFVEIRALFKGGVLGESADNNGATLLMSKLLLKGTPTRSAEQLATEIESVGGHLDSYSANNSFGVTAEVLRDDLDTGLDLVSDVLLRPSFPETSFERERTIQLAHIKAEKDELLPSAFRLMRQGLFQNRGYGRQTTGTEESVRGLSVSDIQSMHRRLVVPNNCVLAVYGDVDAEHVKAEIEKYFGAWKAGDPVLETPEHIAPPETKQAVREERDKKQAVLSLGFPGASIHDEDRYALELIQEACSDLGSRLFMRIRDELGLAYYVGAQNMLGLVPGYFAFYVGTEPSKVEMVEKEMFAEAKLLAEQGLSEEELRRAKAKILGQRKIGRQDLGHQAVNAALDELYGLGFDYGDGEDELYERVSLAQVQAAARQHLNPDHCVVAWVTPSS